jgi:hypothetical protein
MFRSAILGALAVLAIASIGTIASADIVCPDSSYCIVAFTNPAKDRITIGPAFGDTFAGTGITIRVFLKNCQGQPLVGVPFQEIVLFNSGLCICPGGNTADAATDLNGMTTFSGTIHGGGCVNSLQVFADGVGICSLAVKTNSWDALPSSPCFVDAGDLAALSARLGSSAIPPVGMYSICFDWNEDGFIDAGDVASFASPLGQSCQ